MLSLHASPNQLLQLFIMSFRKFRSEFHTIQQCRGTIDARFPLATCEFIGGSEPLGAGLIDAIDESKVAMDVRGGGFIIVCGENGVGKEEEKGDCEEADQTEE